MSVRSAPQRRSRPSLAARVRVFWVLGLLALGAIIVGVTYLVNAPWLRVTEVLVDVPPGTPISERAVRAAAAIPDDANVFLVRGSSIRARVTAIPYVEAVTVARTIVPHPTITIRVTARAPVACLRAPSGTVTVDASPRVVQRGCADAALVRFDVPASALAAPGAAPADPGVARLLADARVLDGAHVGVRSLAYDRFGGLVAGATDGVTLLFGREDDLAQKATLVAPIRSTLRGRTLRQIDLRAPGTPTVRFADGKS